MADNIVRLKVDSAEYDSKIKRAAQGMQALEKKVRKMGATFEVAEKEDLEFVRALGQMETVSRSAKGKVGELTAAFTDLKIQYNRLTEEEKKSPFGQALSGSLDQLKGRIAEGKKELESINKELGNTSSEGDKTGGVMEMLTSKFGLSFFSVTKLAGGLGTAATACKVAKDAFFANEEQLDEWGRVTESASSVYQAFLDHLNTGDMSGFFRNIANVIQASREAYDALDTLATFNAFNQINMARARTGMSEAIVGYREGTTTKEEAKAAGEVYKKELKTRQQFEKDAYLKKIKEVAAERGVSAKDLTDALSGEWGNYEQLKNVKPTGERLRPTFNGPGMAPTLTVEKYAQTREEQLGQTLRQLNDTELKSLQALGAAAENTSTEISQIDKQLSRVLRGNPGGSTGGGTRGGGGGGVQTFAAQALNVSAMQGLDRLAGISGSFQMPSIESIKREIAAYQKMFNESTSQSEKLKLQAYIATDQSLLEALQAPEDWTIDENGVRIPVRLELPKDIKPLEFPATVAKESSKAWQEAARAIASAGSALQGMEDPGVKVAGTIAQAVANIALGFAQATASPATSAAGVFGWIAAATSGLATMIATISTIKSSAYFAEGGILGGQNYSGDIMPARVNSGEMIINQTDQRALYEAIHSGNIGGAQTMHVVTRGENTYYELRNYMRRTGKRL